MKSKVPKLLYILSLLLLVFSSFSTWLALNEYLRFNIFILVLISIVNMFFYPKSGLLRVQKNTKVERQSMCVFLIIVSLSFIVNLNLNYQPKIISNYVATIFIILFLYYYYSSVIEKYLSREQCIKGLAYGGLLVLVIIVVDSLLVNFGGIEINPYFIIGYEGNTSYFWRSAWVSPASPTEEPGITAVYLNMLFPFVLYYFKRRFHLILWSLYLFSLFSLFSTAGLFVASSGLLLIIYLKFNSLQKIVAFTVVIATVFVLFTVFYHNEYVQEFISQWNFVDKITLSGESASSAERSYGLMRAIKDGLENPFLGQGPGYGKYIIDVGYLSTFLGFLGMYGFIAFTAFLVYWISVFKKCFNLSREVRYCFIFSFYAITISAVIGDNLHSFGLWMLIPIVTKFYNDKSPLQLGRY